MASYDTYEVDALAVRVSLLEETVADLAGEIARMRSTPDLAPRVRDLEYRLGLEESDIRLQELSRRVDALDAALHTAPDPMMPFRYSDSTLPPAG